MADKKVSRSTLNKALANWFISSAVAMNYENFQGVGFAYSMVPVTKELYGDDQEARKEAMERSLTYFNCTPEIAVIHGLSIAMEEQIASGSGVTGDDVISVKSALMGPLAGIGDAVVQGIIIPIMLALCINLTQNGLIFGPILYILAMYAIMIAFAVTTFRFGYKSGSEQIANMLADGIIEKVLSACGIMGCTVMGGLIVNYVKLNCGLIFTIGQDEFNLQTGLFDVIMPFMLPLALTLGITAAYKKGVKTTTVIIALIVIGIIGGWLGILA